MVSRAIRSSQVSANREPWLAEGFLAGRTAPSMRKPLPSSHRSGGASLVSGTAFDGADGVDAGTKEPVRKILRGSIASFVHPKTV